MKLFRQKNFTIREGHYTGPKDMDKVPGAVEVIGKSALAGSGIGALIGGVVKDSSVLSGAGTGAKIGTISGVILKFFLNYLHNPMNTIKYQEVDKLIRREFGIYRAVGVTVGDTLDKRATLDEKFAFNDRNVTNYKLCFAIQNNAITMYTLGMTNKELDLVSNTLDYYCKKYFSMEYTSRVMNERTNSYSVSIVFTNYQVIANFIMELSKLLNTKINLLDNKALVEIRFREKQEQEAANPEETRTFSAKVLNRYDLIKVLGGYPIANSIGNFFRKESTWKNSITDGVMGLLLGSIEKIGTDEVAKLTAGTNIPIPRDFFSNKYLEDALKRGHYVANYDYAVGKLGNELNISLISGMFIITVSKKFEKFDSLDKLIRKTMGIKKTDMGDVVVYNYPLKTKNEFDYFLKKFMSLDLQPNIFEK